MNEQDSASGGTIGDLQQRLGAALDLLGELITQGRLPQELSSLRRLAPRPGSSARVRLVDVRNGKPRDIRDDAPGQRWQPEAGSLAWIEYQDSPSIPVSRQPDAVREAPAVGSTVLSEPLRDVVRQLDQAESGKPYVVLRWFLDTWLAGSRLSWATEPAARQRALSEAIQAGLVLTEKVPNPKNPQWPSTTIRLDRSRIEVAELLAASGQLPPFDPIPVRGEPVSETIIRERR